jgi:pimeloyl-ACP methyl ester carboxylesterase
MTSIRALLRTSAAVTAGLFGLTMAGATDAAGSRSTSADHPARPKPTVVLVHGAWADGSSWAAVGAELRRNGFVVDIAPNPLRGVVSDTRYLKDYLATVHGPIVLVGHSYGGMVITNAGNSNVQALVYVNAYIPKQGETVEQLTGAQPGSTLDPNTAIDAVPLHDAAGGVLDTDLYIKPAQFPALFAADVPASTTTVLAGNQRPMTLSALSEKSPDVAAWETIPSWALVGTADRVLPPAGQQSMATRANAEITKVPAPHLSMISDPGAVSELITAAAAGSR